MFKVFTELRGPDLKKSVPTTLEFSGTKVHFNVPGYSYEYEGFVPSEEFPMKYDLDDFSLYRSILNVPYSKEPYDKAVDIAGIGAFRTSWGFRPPWFGDKKDGGYLNFGVGGYHIERHGNLFKPQNLEAAIFDYLETHFGPNSHWGKRKRRYRCPMDWEVFTFGQHQWVGFFNAELWTDGGGDYMFITPLTEHHFLNFSFRTSYKPSPKLLVAFKALTKAVISTVCIEYSREVQEQINKAEREGLGRPYSQTREPLAWEVYDLEPERFLQFKTDN